MTADITTQDFHHALLDLPELINASERGRIEQEARTHYLDTPTFQRLSLMRTGLYRRLRLEQTAAHDDARTALKRAWQMTPHVITDKGAILVVAYA